MTATECVVPTCREIFDELAQPLGAVSAASATRMDYTAVYCRTVQAAWWMLVWRVSFDQSPGTAPNRAC
jgi:hypothetical protein